MRVDALLKLVDEKASVGDYQLGGGAQGDGWYSFLVVVVAAERGGGLGVRRFRKFNV
jgi:hypothetical protein